MSDDQIFIPIYYVPAEQLEAACAEGSRRCEEWLGLRRVDWLGLRQVDSESADNYGDPSGLRKRMRDAP